ncbi:L-serine dehydratase [Mucinivorans hirudinis]|uniref:L-serine ammonia-lyase n=1 Tax=Mucinivorans hirudinis TaxID=1433126 RepID=A0A060R7H8_9BACT|nr:L-serine dehydratase [Mucinivorans hirudinis]
MESIKGIFRIGNGPSSSHTMGPRKAAIEFLERNSDAHRFEVTLYGALAATGKGHLTDQAILDVLARAVPTEIIWKPTQFLTFHPNGMMFEAFDAIDKKMESWTIFSIGGGSLANEKTEIVKGESVYDMCHIGNIMDWCNQNGTSYWEYVDRCEQSDIWDYLAHVWEVMQTGIRRGLDTDGVLPGGLGVRRKASDYYIRSTGYTDAMRNRGLVYSYALATSEENAAGGEIVTAPTCGSSGVLPAVLYHLQQTRNFSKQRILRALATAGLFGAVVKHNASVSGADVGCQGEVGVACAMAAAAACQLFGGTTAQIEYAAEMGLEHHLGLTCDPICGLVQIPCIERNAFAAARAMDSNIYSNYTDGRHRVSFDRVVEVMRETGHDIPSLYKETAEGGLAKAGSF